MISIKGKYTMGYVLTKKLTYTFTYESNTLKIIVDALDIQKPTITCEEDDNILSLNNPTQVASVMRYFDVKDNDQVASVQIKHDDTVYNWTDTIVEGEHTLIVADRTGNVAVHEFIIEL